MAKIMAQLSSVLGHMILVLAALSYVGELIQKPFEQVATIGLGAFAMIGALSGLCFAMAPILTTKKSKDLVLYSGEKFFHSTILILQSVALKWASEAALSKPYMRSYPVAELTLTFGSHILVSSVSIIGTYFLLYGFETVNDLLWERFLSRRKGGEAE